MKLALIAAIAPNRLIGKDGSLPWDLPKDLQHFKKLTTNHPIVMGRKTYESIGKSLPKRRNIVLSSTPINTTDNIENYNSIPNLLNQLKKEDIQKEIFIIGGESIYKQFIDKANRLYLTEIHKEYQGDTYFPKFKDKFHEIQREKQDKFDFVIYEKTTN